MYGYVLAAAEAGIDTRLLKGVVQYTDHWDGSDPAIGAAIRGQGRGREGRARSGGRGRGE
jgi:hypothetical protein